MTTDELMALARDSQGFGWNVTKKQLRAAIEQALGEEWEKGRCAGVELNRQALAEAREEGSKQQMMTGLLSLFGLPVVGEQPDPVKPVAWIDEFGNTFPLAAWAKSEVREKWKPLYTYPPKEQP